MRRRRTSNSHLEMVRNVAFHLLPAFASFHWVSVKQCERAVDIGFRFMIHPLLFAPRLHVNVRASRYLHDTVTKLTWHTHLNGGTNGITLLWSTLLMHSEVPGVHGVSYNGGGEDPGRSFVPDWSADLDVHAMLDDSIDTRALMNRYRSLSVRFQRYLPWVPIE